MVNNAVKHAMQYVLPLFVALLKLFPRITCAEETYSQRPQSPSRRCLFEMLQADIIIVMQCYEERPWTSR